MSSFKIIVKDLSKSFSKNKILHNISFSLHSGELLMIIGDIGIGKSTLLKLIAGIISSENGVIKASSNKNLSELIGYSSSSERSFFLRLSVMENLIFFLRMRGFSEIKARKNIMYYLDLFNLREDFADTLFFNLSSGQKKIVSFIRAIAHNPSILILDEPFVSLDEASSKTIENIIRTKYKSNDDFIYVSCISFNKRIRRHYF